MKSSGNSRCCDDCIFLQVQVSQFILQAQFKMIPDFHPLFAALIWVTATSTACATFNSEADPEACTIVNGLKSGSYAVLCSRIRNNERQEKSVISFTFEKKVGKYVVTPSIEVDVTGTILHADSVTCSRDFVTDKGLGSIICISVHEVLFRGSMICTIVYSSNVRLLSTACTTSVLRLGRTVDGAIRPANSIFCSSGSQSFYSAGSVICISGHEVRDWESIVCTAIYDLKDRFTSIACTTSNIGVRETDSFHCSSIQGNSQLGPLLGCISISYPVKSESNRRLACTSVYDLSGKAASIACSDLDSAASNVYSIDCKCLNQVDEYKCPVQCTSHHRGNDHHDTVPCYALFNKVSLEGSMSCQPPVKNPEVKNEVSIREDSVESTFSWWNLAEFVVGKIIRYGFKLGAGYLNIAPIIVNGALEVYNMFQGGVDTLPYNGLKQLVNMATSYFGLNEKVVNCANAIWDLYDGLNWGSAIGLISDCVLDIIR